MADVVNVDVSEVEVVSVDVHEYHPTLLLADLVEKLDVHNDDILLIEDSQAGYVKKKIRARRLTDGGQFT